jgi:hypothetical protein
MSNQFSVSNAKLSFNITEDVHWFTQTSENIEGATSGNWQDEEKQTKNTTQYVLDTTVCKQTICYSETLSISYKIIFFMKTMLFT